MKNVFQESVTRHTGSVSGLDFISRVWIWLTLTVEPRSYFSRFNREWLREWQTENVSNVHTIGMESYFELYKANKKTWVTEWLSGWVTKWLMTEWLSDWVTEWLSDWVTEWLSKWVTEWLSDWVTEWLSDQLTEWPCDWRTEWLGDRVTEWPCEWGTKWLST